MQDRGLVASQLHALAGMLAPLASFEAERARGDLSAAAWHLTRRPGDRPIVALIGGTGTGKSTLVNRLCGAELTVSSFKRTFTAGPIGISSEAIPAGFANLPHTPADSLPARGAGDRLTTVSHDAPLLRTHTLVDTPDVDGELAEHHALADRLFRWADAVVFLVTPEKYQMTELQPYYRLVSRYGLPALYVMNKVDDPLVLRDFRGALSRAGVTNEPLAVARDDSTWQPAAEQAFDAPHVAALKISSTEGGLRQRALDALTRVNDQLLQPLLDRRQMLDRATGALRAIAGDNVAIDVHPLTAQLQRKMRQRSILYLIGPQRMLDRLRSAPTMLARLPRGLWDWSRGRDFNLGDLERQPRDQPPDFRADVTEQFQALQTRIDDVIRQTTAISEGQPPDWKIEPADAGKIVDEELADLQQWLESRRDAQPWDTKIVLKLLKLIGVKKDITHVGEAAPYLVAIATATSVAWSVKSSVTGGLDDLLIFGGYSLFTWFTHKLSEEVTAKTRATNTAIDERYRRLAEEQIERAIGWLATQAPPRQVLARASEQMDAIRLSVG